MCNDKMIYSFAFLGVFVVSCFVVGLCLFLPLGSIILFGDRSRLFNLGIFLRALLFLRSLLFDVMIHLYCC